MEEAAPVRSSTHLDSLDGIRAVAIAGVFLLHIGRAYFPGGAFGVDVFFLLSAFLITNILLSEVHHQGRIDFRGFYWRRFFRLAPALILWLAFIAPPTAVLAHEAGKIPWSTTGALFYFNDFLEAKTQLVVAAYDQSWSLAIEEQFYFVWPVLCLLCVTRLPRSMQQRTVLALVIGSAVISYKIGNYFLPSGHLVPLALGAWAAFWSVQSRDKSRLAPLFRDVRVAVGCGAVFAVALLSAPAGLGGYSLSLLVDLAALALVLHCVLNVSSGASRALRGGVPRWIGQRSYGIYLYGLTLMQLIPSVTHLSLHFAAPLDVVVTAIVVAISFRYVESPIRFRGRNWLSERGEDGGPTEIATGIEVAPVQSDQ